MSPPPLNPPLLCHPCTPLLSQTAAHAALYHRHHPPRPNLWTFIILTLLTTAKHVKGMDGETYTQRIDMDGLDPRSPIDMEEVRFLSSRAVDWEF